MKKLSTKRMLATILCLAALVGTVSGCGATPANSPATDTASGDAASVAAPSGKPIELFSQKKENVEIYNEIMKDFMEANPDIPIVQTTTVGGTTFVARVAANDLPDIGGIYYNPTYHAMMDEGLFLDQTGEAYFDKINDDVVEMMKYKDKLYALPITLNGFALYYNEDIYAQHNLKVPTTIDELFENCEKLRAAGVTPFAFPYKDTGALGQLFERFLGGAVDHEVWKICEEVAAGTKKYSDYPEIANYMEKWYKLASYADTDPLSTDTDDVAGLFANGEVAMVINGTWGCSVYENLNPDLNFEAVLVPTISGIEATTAGTVDIALAISASSSQIENSKKFLEYFVSDPVAQKFAEADKNPNSVKAVNYEISNMTQISDAIAAGRFSWIPMTFQPAGFRDEIQVELQQLLLDGDIPSFLSKWDGITDQFYNQQ